MQITGSHIAVKIGSMSPVLVPGCQSWSADSDLQELDATTAEDLGYDHPEGGVAGLTVNAMFVVDIVSGDFTAIANGTALADLKLYKRITDTAPVYHLPNAKVFKSTFRGEIKGRVTYDCVIKSQGPFTENLG